MMNRTLQADAYSAHAIVWPVVSNPPVNRTPISAASLSSGNGLPVLGSVMRSKWAAIEVSESLRGPLAFISLNRSDMMRLKSLKSSSPLFTDC